MKTKGYDWKKTLEKFLWAAVPGVLLAAASAGNDYVQGAETINWEGFAAALAGGVVIGVRNAWRNWDGGGPVVRPPYHAGGWLMILGLGAVCLTFPGCLSLAPYSPAALSSNEVTVREETSHADGLDVFEMKIRSRGDAAAKTSVKYSGEAESDETPWNFAVLGEANVESAERVKPLIEGTGAALAALPDTIAPLLSALATVQGEGPGTPGGGLRAELERRIVEMIMEHFAGRGGLLGGAVTP